MKHENIIPMKLQLFAEGNSTGGETSQQNGAGGGQNTNTAASASQIDYDKLAGIINGKQTVAEETVLKSYFKEQGLSGEEMKQAIASFKEQKAKNTPDPVALKNQLDAANRLLMTERINNQATLQAMALGIDAKSIPYIIKMADMGSVTNEKGEIAEENVKKAIEKVLEDIPALKGNAASSEGGKQKSGFQIGGAVGNDKENESEDILRDIFGIKK